MKKILIVLLLLFSVNLTALAAPDAVVNSTDQSQVAVVVFMDKRILQDSKAVAQTRDILKEKFKYANSLAIYGDDQAKSPEFLEFIEKTQTDPVNEKEIRTINMGALAKYGRDIKANYVVLITISPCNIFYDSFAGVRIDLKEHVSVIDAQTSRYVESLNWYNEASNVYRLGSEARDLIKRFTTEFIWTPPANLETDKNMSIQPEEKKNSVVVFLPDIILEKAELVEKIRQIVSEKFNVSETPIYVDNKPKSSAFLNLIGKVGTDSAKQQTFVLKKEHLVEYGKATNSTPVIAIVISQVGKGEEFSYHLKEDIFVVDSESNKYLANVVYDTIDNKKRQEGIDLLLKKLQNEFKLP